MVLSFSFFGCSIPLGIMCVDGLTSHTIATNKFASDFLITNLNFFSFIIWVTLILIFYPRKSGAMKSGFSTPDGANGTPQAQKHISKDDLPKFNMVQPQYYRMNEPAETLDEPTRAEEISQIGRRHERTFSNESHKAIFIPIDSPTTAVPLSDATRVTSLTPPPRADSGKPQLVSGTIYYHEALAKAQQQQKEQENEDYTKCLQNGTIYDHSAPPQRSLSNNSAYSAQSQHLLITKPSKNPSRSTPSAMDYRPSDYPSLAQGTTVWSQNQPDDIHRSLSNGSLRQQQNQQAQQHHMRNDMSNDMRAASAMALRSNSEESDRELIQIAYMRNPSQGVAASGPANNFYDGVQA
ncbi:hypothetical protein BGX27_001484 [Mortierella sp. AM989]|nr:hypothetical protein BGX27_001484 [Mortierella sp. AM989]